jgi:hypothetical protein
MELNVKAIDQALKETLGRETSQLVDIKLEQNA